MLIKITGPAILFRPDVIAKGSIGTGHMMLWDRLKKALAKKKNISLDKADDIINNAPENKIIMGFMTSDGKFVNREQAWKIAKEYKKNVQAMDQRGSAPVMASEYL